MIHADNAQELKGLALEYFVPPASDLLHNKLNKLFLNPDSFSMTEVENMSSCARLLLEIYRTQLESVTIPTSSTVCVRLGEMLISTCRHCSRLTTEFLRLLHENIPVRGLVQTIARHGPSLPTSITDLFRGMKRDIIDTLTLLIHRDKEIQNTVRERGGLPLLLSQTHIDEDNPCMRFYDSLTIRYQRAGDPVYSSMS